MLYPIDTSILGSYQRYWYNHHMFLELDETNHEVWALSVQKCEFFHADVHAGNLLVLEDWTQGTLEIWGSCQRFDVTISSQYGGFWGFLKWGDPQLLSIVFHRFSMNHLFWDSSILLGIQVMPLNLWPCPGRTGGLHRLWHCRLGFLFQDADRTGVGRCPVLGEILKITWKSICLLEIIFPVVGWCSIRTLFTNPCRTDRI